MVQISQSLLNQRKNLDIQRATAQLFSDDKKKTLVFVEGESDRDFFGLLFNKEKCYSQAVVGKEKVIKLVKEYEIKRNGVLGVVDSDFDYLKKIVYQSTNLMMTDYHDIEAMIFHSDTFEKIITFFGDNNKIANIENFHQKKLKNVIIDIAKFIGLLLFYNNENDIGLKLNYLEEEIHLFIDPELFQIDKSEFIRYILDKCDRLNSLLFDSEIYILDTIKDIEDLDSKYQDIDPLIICRGHDLAKLLGFGFKKSFGNKHKWKINSKEKVETQFYLSYEYEYFKKTNLYASLIKWEERNVPFLIVKK